MPVLHLTVKMNFVEQNKHAPTNASIIISDTQIIYTIIYYRYTQAILLNFQICQAYMILQLHL